MERGRHEEEGGRETRKTHTRDTARHGKETARLKKGAHKKYTEFAPVQGQQQQHEEVEEDREEEDGEEGAKEAATGQQPGPVKSKRN